MHFPFLIPLPCLAWKKRDDDDMDVSDQDDSERSEAASEDAHPISDEEDEDDSAEDWEIGGDDPVVDNGDDDIENVPVEFKTDDATFFEAHKEFTAKMARLVSSPPGSCTSFA
jgi:hypothetical protein